MLIEVLIAILITNLKIYLKLLFITMKWTRCFLWDHQTFSLLCRMCGIFINLLFILFSYKGEFEFRKKESWISSINLTKVIKSKTLFLWIQECQTYFIIHFEFKLPLNNLFPFILHYKKNALTEFENLMMGFREQLFPETYVSCILIKYLCW